MNNDQLSSFVENTNGPVAGSNPSLAQYDLVPIDGTGISLAEQYRRRSCANVRDADATLAFRFHKSAGRSADSPEDQMPPFPMPALEGGGPPSGL